MNAKSTLREVPKTGAALLVVPHAGPEMVAKAVMLSIAAHSEALCRGPDRFVYRLEDDPSALVFLEPVPQLIVDLIVDLLGADVKPVRLEELSGLMPALRLAPAGVRMYIGPEDYAQPLIH